MALYARVREAITGGIYRWGGKLPSKRAMAERYGVSVITVEHAYALLAEEGYVEPRERSGYFIIYKEEDAFPVGYRGKGSLFFLRRQMKKHFPFPFMRKRHGQCSPNGAKRCWPALPIRERQSLGMRFATTWREAGISSFLRSRSVSGRERSICTALWCRPLAGNGL